MKISLFISLLLILIIVVSCAPRMTDEELEAKLAKLTPKEREALIEYAQGRSAPAGMAIASKYPVSKAQLKRVLNKMATPSQDGSEGSIIIDW